MPIKIHNKNYMTVVERVNIFRNDEKYTNWAIATDIVKMEGDDCIIKATIADDNQRIAAVGHAHEVKGSTNINKTSHVENCETSAIGRALAALGLAGTEYASGDEVGTAVINQAVQGATDKLKGLISAIMMYHSSIMSIKQGIIEKDLSTAAESWFELPDDTKMALWISPTSGGIFSTTEREIIKSTEFREAFCGPYTEKD